MTRVFNVGSSTVTILFGDITQSSCQALVSSDDYRLSMGGGVSAALRRAGGSAILDDAVKVGHRKLGDVVVTTGGLLPACYVLHAITIGPVDLPEVPTSVVVRSATRRVMELLPLLGCQSVAFPAIGTGAAGMDYQEVAAELAASLVESLLSTSVSYRVEIYITDRYGWGWEGKFLELLASLLDRRFGPLAASEVPQPEDRSTQMLHLLRQLDARRRVLESRLIEILNDDSGVDPVLLARVRTQLDELNDVALNYERARLSPVSITSAGAPGSVFVSSTSQDLASHRASVRGVLDRLRLSYVGMEDFPPESAAPADMIRRRVMQSEMYLGILGMRYGHVDEGTGISMTELEYQQAVAGCKPLRIFVMSDDAPIKASMVERDPAKLEKLNDFKARVLSSHSCGLFSDEKDLAQKVEQSLQ